MSANNKYRRPLHPDRPGSKAKLTNVERREWSDAVNDMLDKMRDADAAGENDKAARYGDEANRLYIQGPLRYKYNKQKQKQNENV